MVINNLFAYLLTVIFQNLQTHKRKAKTQKTQPLNIKAAFSKLEAEAGFEPANTGFANRRLRPLGHSAF